MGWAAAHLPFSIVGLAMQPLSPETALILWSLSKLSFTLLMVFALRVVFNVSYFSVFVTLAISWSSILLESAIFWVTSPFLIFWIYYYLRGDIGSVGMDVASSFRQRQSFRRHLEACTINPQDAEAHYQLGLIHQQRRQYSEAIARFKKAIEIDTREIDAHFQLGVIAREQNRLQEAISHFDSVVLLDDKHSNNEVWREIGATYEAAGMNEDAYKALEKYIERRPYDAEGLYYYGKTLFNLKQNDKAKEMFNRCIEAADTAPYHRRGQLRRWRKLAQGLLKNLN
jgi:tetratricopeptide (TPR) repeat protein